MKKFLDSKARARNATGIYVKVMYEERDSIFGTAWYQANHASIKRDAKRAHVVTWVGGVSYRKFKVKVVKKAAVCPICKFACVRLLYSGHKHFVLDRYASGYVRCSLEDYKENGVVVWDVAPERVFRSKRFFSGESFGTVGVQPRYGSLDSFSEV